jgi:hypothetical protein
MNAILLAAAFAAGVATPVAAWRYSVSHPGYTTPKDVTLMSDGSPQTGDGVWDGHLADPIERFFFYVLHPRAPRPQGKGDLWILEQREKWVEPIRIACNISDGSCRTKMPENVLKRSAPVQHEKG